MRAGGLAEARLGAGRGERHVLFVAIGTGIAAAHVVDGTVLAGAHGAAGEIGHIVVRPGGAAVRLRRRAAAWSRWRRPPRSAAATRDTGRCAGATAADVAARAAAGEPTATRGLAGRGRGARRRAARPRRRCYDAGAIVVLGGGLAEAGDTLLDPLRAALQRRVTFHRMPRARPRRAGRRRPAAWAPPLLALDALGDRTP